MDLRRLLPLVLIVFGVTFSSMALRVYAWSNPPAGTPPACPTGQPGCDAPLNVGGSFQSKDGNLMVNAAGSYATGLSVPYGNVGIGTASPGAKLQVSAGDSSMSLFGPNASWAGYLYVGAGGSQITGQRAQVISTNGNLHLDSAPTSYATYINYYSQTPTYINAQGGNVGIGKTNPAYKLDVNGTINASSILVNGVPVGAGSNISFNVLTPSTGDSPNAGFSHYAIYEEPGLWNGSAIRGYPYPDMVLAYHTGMSYVAYYGYGGHRFYTGYTADATPTTLSFSVGEGDNNTRVYGNLYVSGTAYASNGQALCQVNGVNCPAGIGADPTFNSVYYGNGNLRLSQGDGTGLRVTTGYGYVNIGAQNSSWTHIYSDKNFYFNQNLYINGNRVYADNYHPSADTLSPAGRSTFTADDSGLHVINAEGTGSNVRLGAAWGRPGIYNSPSITIGSEDSIYFVTQNVQRGRIDSSANLDMVGTIYQRGGQTVCDNSNNCGYLTSGGTIANATNATYGRYVYNNGAYSGSGWVEPSSLGVYYAYLGRLVYNNGAYSGSGWIEPSDLGVRYAGSANSATYATYINSDAYWTKLHWAGQSGQPTWLWGSNNGTDAYVWNPANFSVNYATSAGTATDAYYATTLSGVQKNGPYAGSTAGTYYHLGSWGGNGWGPDILVERARYADSAGGGWGNVGGYNNALSAGYTYTSVSNDGGNGWPDYADSAGSATYGRYVYNNGAYSGSGWVEPSDLGVRYANSAGYASSAGSAPANGGNSSTVGGKSVGTAIYSCPTTWMPSCPVAGCGGQLQTGSTCQDWLYDCINTSGPQTPRSCTLVGRMISY